MPAPILFIHYGPAHYLRWTLQAARKNNPEKRIVLLGDESNRSFAKGLAEFFLFEHFAYGNLLHEFENTFQVIQGERHRFHKEGGIETWLRFVFRRWFLIHNFISKENISHFWTFDSDTLLLAPLSESEPHFADVDATTQCRGQCLNGWVGSSAVVEAYLRCIITLFSDKDYLAKQRERLRAHAGLAFNEMDAFAEFCTRSSIKTCRASMIIEGRAFDDALAILDGYEPAPKKILDKTRIKRLWISPSGKLYARFLQEEQFVHLLSCNMSWMPDFFWKRLLALTIKSSQKSHDSSMACLREDLLQEISLERPWFMKVKEMFLRYATIVPTARKVVPLPSGGQ